ncbi:Vitellogenin-like 4, partial [Homarus americanus]
MYCPYSRLPLPTKIREFEFQGGLGGWHVTSFIRQTRESGEMTEHSSAFKIAHRHQELISINATQISQRRLKYNFVLRTSAVVKLGSVLYEAIYNVHCEDAKTGAAVQIIRSGDNKKIINFEAYIYSKLPQSAKLL